jgi:hypothetical protein
VWNWFDLFASLAFVAVYVMQIFGVNLDPNQASAYEITLAFTAVALWARLLYFAKVRGTGPPQAWKALRFTSVTA